MKDILEKHHRGRNFYLRKKLVIIVSILFGLSATVAIPVGINIYNQAHVQQVKK